MYQSTIYRKTARIVSTACGFLFIAFAVLYLYEFQPYLLATAQHVLSNGVTSYSPVWGTLIISFILILVQIGYKRLVRFPLRFVALSYFPSCLILGVLTALVPGHDGGMRIDVSWLTVVLLILFYLLLLWMIKHFPDTRENHNILSPFLWPNFFILFLLFLMTGSVGNTNDIYHYRLDMENHLIKGEYKSVLQIGTTSLETDRAMSAMRAYALSRTGELNEKLFEYPQPYGSEGLLPSVTDTVYAHNWADSLYIYLGGKPGKVKNNVQFFELLITKPYATDKVKDYLLCAYLLDKRLDKFVSLLSHYYTPNDNLPTVYKEALVLYNRMHVNPIMIYHDSVTEENLNDFLEMEEQYADPVERSNRCRRMYGHTYWWYYRYQRVVMPDEDEL